MTEWLWHEGYVVNRTRGGHDDVSPGNDGCRERTVQGLRHALFYIVTGRQGEPRLRKGNTLSLLETVYK